MLTHTPPNLWDKGPFLQSDGGGHILAPLSTESGHCPGV